MILNVSKLTIHQNNATENLNIYRKNKNNYIISIKKYKNFNKIILTFENVLKRNKKELKFYMQMN